MFPCSSSFGAEPTSIPKILCRPELASARRQELASKLSVITGWPALHFDETGALSTGSVNPVGGSPTARQLIADAALDKNIIILEDASERPDVVFCRVVKGRWKKDSAGKPSVYVIQIDFADFSHVMGNPEAMAAFNVAWGVLHEIEHVVHDSVDAENISEVGQCEEIINQMRRECDLSERVEYFFTYIPGAQQGDFKTKFVRLAFDKRPPHTLKKKRYWIYWDANVIGGLKNTDEVAARRR